MSCSYHDFDTMEKDIPLQGYSSEFVTMAMARLVIPKDPEQNPADLTIKCGSLNVEAHSFVLSQDSSYFKIISKGGFLEEYTQELSLPAEEELLMRRLLCYCYTTGYNDEPYDDEEDPPPHMQAQAYINRLHLNAQMYSIADKYDIPSLKEKAVQKFEIAVLEIDEQQRIHPECGASLIDQIIEAIPQIYSSTPDGDRRLRDRAVRVVCWKKRGFKEHPDLRDLMVAVPEFFEERRIKSMRLPPRLASFSQCTTRCGSDR